MTKIKPKRQTPTHSDRAARHGKAGPKAARPATRPNTSFTVRRRHQPSSRQPGRPQSKQARIVAMLQGPAGATIDSMMHATGWQQHSVRGFLAGVIRKKLGLNLVSKASENGRVYRIAAQAVSPIAAVKTSRAA